MNTLKTLIAARSVITNPSNWTKYTRDNQNGAHCALGAVDAVLIGAQCDYHPAVAALAAAMTAGEKKIAEKAFGCEPGCAAVFVAQFNNGSDHASVLALFDRTIEQQRAIDRMSAPVSQERGAELV